MYLRIIFVALLCLPVIYIIHILFNLLKQSIYTTKLEKESQNKKKYDRREDDIYLEFINNKSKTNDIE